MENMVHDMVAEEVSATHSFARVMEGLGAPRSTKLDPTLEHILVSGMFSAFFEMIIHDVPYERTSEGPEAAPRVRHRGLERNGMGVFSDPAIFLYMKSAGSLTSE